MNRNIIHQHANQLLGIKSGTAVAIGKKKKYLNE
jgi:hypothetical protein